MTDEQIIKALEICANDGDCKDCNINPHKGNYGYCTSLAIKEALDLINRQKAEIEQLQKRIVFWREDMDYRPDEIKAEAIKEFAELKIGNTVNICAATADRHSIGAITIVNKEESKWLGM